MIKALESEEDQKQILQASGQDELLKKALEGYQYLDEDKAKVFDRLDQRFDAILHKNKKKSNPSTSGRVISLRFLSRIAVAIMIILVPTVLLVNKPSPEKLFKSYFQAPQSSYYVLKRGGENNQNGEIQQAFILYEKGEFQAASKAIQQLIRQNPDKLDLQFYHGISLLGAGQTPEAISVLSTCLDISYQNLDQKTPWYLGLAYLKAGKVNSAKQWLNMTIILDDTNARNAKALLKKLN